MSDADLLRAAIERSGLTVERWHREVLAPACGLRPPNIRTVWRWLAGTNALPEAVREKCKAIVNQTQP